MKKNQNLRQIENGKINQISWLRHGKKQHAKEVGIEALRAFFGGKARKTIISSCLCLSFLVPMISAYPIKANAIPVETVVDLAFFAYSATSCASNPSFLNCGAAVWDGVAIFIPYVPGSWIAKVGGKTVTKADDVIKLAKATKSSKLTFRFANSVDDVQKSKGILIGTYARCAKLTQGAAGKIQAHHIIEKRFSRTLGLTSDKMVSAVISADLHKLVTKRWDDIIARNGTSYYLMSTNRLREAVRYVYSDMPILRDLAMKELDNALFIPFIKYGGRIVFYGAGNLGGLPNPGEFKQLYYYNLTPGWTYYNCNGSSFCPVPRR